MIKRTCRLLPLVSRIVVTIFPAFVYSPVNRQLISQINPAGNDAARTLFFASYLTI